eukprot:10004335-Alexandrium_andersonii.AAC.1
MSASLVGSEMCIRDSFLRPTAGTTNLLAGHSPTAMAAAPPPPAEPQPAGFVQNLRRFLTRQRSAP